MSERFKNSRSCSLAFLAAALALLAIPCAGRGDAEITVAIRYLQDEGVSHSHVYLFRKDGKLIRQLTREDAGQDSNPFFSPDGNMIVFTRTTDARVETWSIEPKGTGLRMLSEPPDWYRRASAAEGYSDPESPSKPAPESDAFTGKDGLAHFRLPDGSGDLVVQESSDLQHPGEKYFFDDAKTGKQVALGELSGAAGVFTLDAADRRHFLVERKLRLAFISLHLNSTDGNTTYALNFDTGSLSQLSPSEDGEEGGQSPRNVSPIPLPGEPAFLSLTGVRYVPFGVKKKTANSSFLEYWDGSLRVVRFAHRGASLCYGASIYRPGEKPAAIWIPVHR
jgi:hypothetical protein